MEDSTSYVFVCKKCGFRKEMGEFIPYVQDEGVLLEGTPTHKCIEQERKPNKKLSHNPHTMTRKPISFRKKRRKHG